MAKTKALAKRSETVLDYSKIEQVFIKGNLSDLNDKQRVEYYTNLCSSVGLNPLTKPFEYITLNGRLVLYARKDCTDQLRQIHGVSIKIKDRKKEGDMYTVCAEATAKNGRSDSAIGVIHLGVAKGTDLANAMMKAETKAKRRVTLSICGLGFLDEAEIDDVPRDVTQSNADKLQKQIEEAPTQQADFEKTNFDEFDQSGDSEDEQTELDVLGSYEIKAGKNKGKKIKDIPVKQLRQLVSWSDGQENLHDDVREYVGKAVEYLILIDQKTAEEGA